MEEKLREIQDTLIKLCCGVEEIQKDVKENKDENKGFGKRLVKVEMKVYTMAAGGSVLFGIAVWLLRSKI